MSNEEKIELISRNLEEVLTHEELKRLVESGTPLRHCIGFEISGRVHLGTGLSSLMKVKDLHDAGVETIIFLADWHSWINNKLDGTLETSSRLALEYFAEAMKAAYLCIGGDPDSLKFILGSELYSEKPIVWANMIKVAKATTLSRMLRSTSIMGREAGMSSDTATLFYPSIQASDIYTMEIDIAHSGTDQRNVHVVARDASKAFNKKPVAIHHHLLQGLLKPSVWPIPENDRDDLVTSLKMSKSKPDSAVFIHDTPDEIKRKIMGAFAPEKQVDFNPILDWTKHIIFYYPGSKLQVVRPEKWGGDLEYSNYTALQNDYASGNLHPQDLKTAVADWLLVKLEPARKYFEDPKRAAALEEITSLSQKKV